MNEVTQQNFIHLYPSIAFAIQNAAFISIDTEFSGLFMNDQVKPSLFDSSIERYEKLRKSVSYFSILQFGLTVFNLNAAENRYEATIYNFHLHPSSLSSLEPNLNFQVSGIDFLSKQNFDFNKCFKQGISYMNCKQEQQLIEDFKQGFQAHETENRDFEEEIQKICSLVASWICNEKQEPFFTLSLDKEASSTAHANIHTELRKRFCEIWTSTSPLHHIIVHRVTADRRKFLEEEEKEKDEEIKKKQLLDALGFTRIFRLLQDCKVPIIGHNLFMDLLFMYDKFHDPLPRSFAKFKRDIHEMFPFIFDTKHIFHCMKSKKEFEILKSKTRKLEHLYSIVNCPKFLGLAFMHPSIHILSAESGDDIQNTPHHAGYDSYLCGTVFIRFCHALHFQVRNFTDLRTFSFSNYLPTMKDFANCVNVIRATISHINLVGEEPKSEKPPLLYVSTISSKKVITPTQLSSWFSVYGTVDIRMIGCNHAVVATSNYMTARDLLYYFKHHPTIRVTRYKFWQHSPQGRFLWWTSFLLASGSCFYILYDTFRH